ncbi:hypothetical protein ACWERF_29980 [Streptomyces griseoluteus]
MPTVSSAGGWRRRREATEDVGTWTGRVTTTAYGVRGGFTTMVASAGGKMGFLGTSVFFLFIVSVAKRAIPVIISTIAPMETWQLHLLARGGYGTRRLRLPSRM